MAFEVTKTTVHRLAVSLSCGCKATREFEDSIYEKPLNETEYFGCEKHEGKESGETISLILSEYLDTEAKKAAAQTNIRQVAPNLVIDSEGNEIGNVVPTNRVQPHRRRATLSSAALRPEVPEIIDPGESGDVLDALLAEEDPSTNATTIIPPKISR